MKVISQLVKAGNNVPDSEVASPEHTGSQVKGKKFGWLMMGLLGATNNAEAGESSGGGAPATQSDNAAQSESPSDENAESMDQAGHPLDAGLLENQRPLLVEVSAKVTDRKGGKVETPQKGGDVEVELQNHSLTPVNVLNYLGILSSQGEGTVGNASGPVNLKQDVQAAPVTIDANQPVRGQTSLAADQDSPLILKSINATELSQKLRTTLAGAITEKGPVLQGLSGRTIAEKALSGAKTLANQESQGKQLSLKIMQNGKEGEEGRQKFTFSYDQKQANTEKTKSVDLFNKTDGAKNIKQVSQEQKAAALKLLKAQSGENTQRADVSLMQKESTDNINNSPRPDNQGRIPQRHFAPSVTETKFLKTVPHNQPEFQTPAGELSELENSKSSGLKMEMNAHSESDSSPNEEQRFTSGGRATLNALSSLNGRREFSSQLVRQLQQQSKATQSGSQAWSQHRFILDDGETVNVAVRQMEGAMQLQLSGGNSELNKIIQQHISEIRQHLQEQMDIEVDLQFQFANQQGDQERGAQQTDGQVTNNSGMEGHPGEPEREASPNVVRFLGFNNNEWTA